VQADDFGSIRFLKMADDGIADHLVKFLDGSGNRENRVP
jgi:hypothetical protein